MGQLVANAPDKYDRQNEQQARTALENAIFDLQAQLYSLLTTAGTLRLSDGNITLVNGANNNVAPGHATYVRIKGPTASFSLSGFSGGELGRFLIVRNTTAQQMTLSDEGAASTAANRITTGTGADVILVGAGGNSAVFVYDADTARWMLIATQG